MNLLSVLRTAAFAATDVIASKSLNFNITQNSVVITTVTALIQASNFLVVMISLSKLSLTAMLISIQ